MNPTSIRESWTSAAQGGIGAAIHRAAASTGVDFSYLLGQARIESGFNPNARAKTSSATGLFQFIDQTWLGTVKQHGAKHGMEWAASAIQQGANGRYHVADPATRRAILDLRKDPGAASSMAAEFAADNQSYLENRLGRATESVDLYLAHFLGAGGAAGFSRRMTPIPMHRPPRPFQPRRAPTAGSSTTRTVRRAASLRSATASPLSWAEPPVRCPARQTAILRMSAWLPWKRRRPISPAPPLNMRGSLI